MKDDYFPKHEITQAIEKQLRLWKTDNSGISPSSLKTSKSSISKVSSQNTLAQNWNHSFELEKQHNVAGYKLRIELAFLALEFDKEVKYVSMLILF